MNREIQGEYSSRAIEVIEMFKGVSKPVAANAWTDFENNSILYFNILEHLLKKYGKAKGDYFLTETCATKNKKVSRTSEGLFCHHIDEDKAINLSQDIYMI